MEAVSTRPSLAYLFFQHSMNKKAHCFDHQEKAKFSEMQSHFWLTSGHFPTRLSQADVGVVCPTSHRLLGANSCVCKLEHNHEACRLARLGDLSRRLCARGDTQVSSEASLAKETLNLVMEQLV